MRKVVTSITLDSENLKDAKILSQLNGHKSFSDFINEMLRQACEVEQFRIDEFKKLTQGDRRCLENQNT
jgi:hypothetical protein